MLHLLQAACPHNTTDTECGHCGHGLFELTSDQNRKSGGEASGEIQIPIKPLSRKCATASVAQFIRINAVQLHAYSENDTY